MADTDEARAERLRTIPMFADLDDVGLWHVSQLATKSAARRPRAAQPGQEGAGLFVVVSGTVNVELAGGTNIACTTGEFIGELSLLVDDLVHTGRVRAATPVTCIAIGRGDFTRLLETYPQMALSMLKVLARRLASTDEMLKAR